VARLARAAAPAARARAGGAGADAVLVIGVHRAELSFGEAVADGLDRPELAVFRIPEGIRRARTAPGAEVRSRAEHREIYLQLAQQIGRGPRLLLDLHAGLDETRRAADLFCHDPGALRALDARLRAAGRRSEVRLLRIVEGRGAGGAADGADGTDGTARTWIPKAVWGAPRPLYVGLEVYLAGEGAGGPTDWGFARALIGAIAAAGNGRPPRG
jgi:hypothetical protein